MTINEAIYCMKSYLPGNDHTHCVLCPYYGIVRIDHNIYTCKSDEAHRLAIEALTKMNEE